MNIHSTLRSRLKAIDAFYRDTILLNVLWFTGRHGAWGRGQLSKDRPERTIVANEALYKSRNSGSEVSVP